MGRSRVRSQPGAHQQAGCRQHVQRSIMANIITAGGKATQASRPVHGGFKARNKMRAIARCRPRVFGLLHQLGVRHQHHCVRRVRSPQSHLLADTGDYRRPSRCHMMFFGYVSHSFRACHTDDEVRHHWANGRRRGTAARTKHKQGCNVGRPQPLVSVTISTLYLYPQFHLTLSHSLSLVQGTHHGQRTHQTCL